MREVYSSIDTAEKSADLHTHTIGSDGKMTPFEAVDIAAQLGICAVGLTDHNRLAPGILGKEYALANNSQLEVIPGAEISSKSGHVLGLYLVSDIPSDRPLDWTIESIHEQGGIAIAVHPFATLVRGIGEQGILSVVQHKNPRVYFDGFEVYNAGLDFSPRFNGMNEQALVFYQELLADYSEKLGGAVGSSDAHYFTLGGARTWYNDDLKQALRERKTKVTVGYPNGTFEGLNTSYSLLGRKVFDRYWQLQERTKK